MLPADRFAKVITILTLLVNLLVLLFFIHTELILKPVFILIAVSILAVPTLTFLLSPVKIVLNDSCLIVKKVVGK